MQELETLGQTMKKQELLRRINFASAKAIGKTVQELDEEFLKGGSKIAVATLKQPEEATLRRILFALVEAI